MRRTAHLSLVVVMSVAFLAVSRAQAAIPAEEREALIALYNSTNGDGWSDNSGWKDEPLDGDGFAMPGTECGWHGVECTGDSVTKLQLSSNQLTGSIPVELDNLSNLQTLNLYSNQLTGSIPVELGNLVNLQLLFLNKNQLTGNIPTELSSLAKLDSLGLDSNQLSGSIPTELGNLANLRYLSLGSNQLTGTIPTELGNLANLQSLLLGSNQLTGSIPVELGNLANLQSLSLSSNQLTGSIPPELGKLTNLYGLYLWNNQLSGTIPTELGNLTNLIYLPLQFNQLSGSIPTELGNLTNLQILFLHANQLSGSIPTELGNLVNLTDLYLRSNQLTGSIPDTLEKLTKLVEGRGLSLDWNGLYTTDSDLRDFLNNKSSRDFEATQTVAPANLTPNQLSPTSVELTWTPIAYTGNEGGYRVYYSNSKGGPFSLFDETEGKTDASLTVTGLTPDTKYCFYMETVTYPHADNQNTVVSEKSPIVGSCSMAMPWMPLLLDD